MPHHMTFGTMHPFFEPNTIFGRTTANEGFLSTLLSLDPFDEYVFFLDKPKEMEELLPSLEFPAAKRSAITVLPTQRVIEEISKRDFFCFHCADPCEGQTRLAYIRNHYASTIFPITSVPHTLSYSYFADDFLQEIWPGVSKRDVILATSRAAIHVIESYFSQLRTNYRIPADWGQPSLRLLPLGVDTRKYSKASSTEKEAARKRFDLTPDELVLLTHGRITVDDKMDLLPLLYAVQRVTEKPGNPPLHLIISGKVREHDSYPQVLCAQAKALRIPLTLKENPDAQELKDLYAAADIFVSPSDNIQETFGLTILEAGACGLPVIASNWDGYRDLVKDGETGFLIPTIGPDKTPYLNSIRPILPDNIHQLLRSEQTAVDVKAMALAIEALVAPERRNNMGDAAFAHVHACYSWERYVTEWITIVQELRAIPLPEDEEAQLRAAEHPSYLRFDELFAAHPKERLDEQAMEAFFVKTSNRGKKNLLKQEVSICWKNLDLLMQHADLRKLLTLARKRTSVQSLLSRLSEQTDLREKESALYIILWALKHDLLERDE